jgi:hypothetical protein
MKPVLIFLVLTITLCQKTPTMNDVYNKILKEIKVINSLETVASNKTEMNNKISEVNISESIKDWVKNSSPNKTNSKSNIDLSYDKKEGGKAKGELYYYSRRKKSVNKTKTIDQVVFYYGIAHAELRPYQPIKYKKCRWILFKKICTDYQYSPVIEEENLKTFINMKMREAIRKDIQNKKKVTKL